MQICVAYLVCEKREEEEEEEEEFFLSVASKRPRCRYKKYIYYRLLERRAFDLSRPRALRAPGSVWQGSSSKSRLNCEFQKVFHLGSYPSSPERTRGRREIQKNNEKNNREKKIYSTPQYFTSKTTCDSPEGSSLSIVIWRMFEVDLVVAANTLHFIFCLLICVSFNCVFYFVLLSFAYFWPKKRRKIKSKDISQKQRANQKAHEDFLQTFWMD